MIVTEIVRIHTSYHLKYQLWQKNMSSFPLFLEKYFKQTARVGKNYLKTSIMLLTLTVQKASESDIRIYLLTPNKYSIPFQTF